MRSKILDGGQKPEDKILIESGWIEMSATMDSGVAVTAGVHIGRIGFHTAQSLASSCLYFQSHRVQISGFHGGGVVLLSHGRPARRHHGRVPRSQTQHARRNMRYGKELAAPHADASFPPRPGGGPTAEE